VSGRFLATGAVAAVLAAAAAGCGSGGGGGDKAVATVGNGVVTREQLEQTVEHFREEARREGKAFADGRAVQRTLLQLLVYRARLEQGAAALGITVSDEAVEQRLATAGGDEAGGDEAFAKSSVRAQLLTEAVYRRLSARIREADPERRQAKRNAALERWLRSLPGRYPER
jgi:parvulin-like peptidyl-prolyl isomerase